MNISSILGVLAALGVFIAALLTATESWQIFLDRHAILIVIGGTAAASLICFPLSTFINLFSVFFKKVLGKYASEHEVVIHEVVSLSKGYRGDPAYLQTQVKNIKTLFLKDAIEMLIQGGFSPETVDDILRKRAMTHYKRGEDDAGIFKTIAKFPPAFGLMGTTLGMIALLQNLGSTEAMKKVGPAMAIGLVATLYGIAITNLVLIPIGENLSKLNKQDETTREIVIDGIQLLMAKEHPLVVEEHLKSYLLPSERAKLKKAS